MAETLTELVAKIKVDAAGLEKGLSDAEKQTKASSKNMSDSLKKIGIAMAASGAAITAAMGLMGKAAIDEEINIKHLQVALKGVGVSYDNVKDSLEKIIATTQRKTGIADNEQRDVLSRLILVTKDYDKALKLLPLALDLASYSQMNTASAATYLGKAYEELEAGAEKIGIRMGTTTIYFKDLDEVQKMVGGTAEAMKNPFSVLSATMSDVSETIGAFLIPVIKDAIDKILDITDKVQTWAKENPRLAESLALITAGLGLSLTAIGGLILVLPSLISSYKALTVVANAAHLSTIALLGSVTALLAGVALLTVGLKYLADQHRTQNEIKLEGMRLDVQREKYLRGETNNYKELLAAYIPMLEAYLSVSNAKKEEIEINKQWIIQAKEGLKQLEETEIENKKLVPTIESIKKAIESLRAEYGDLGNAIKSKGDMAKQAAQVAKDALSSELDKARESTDKQLGFLSKLYAEKIRLVNAGAEGQIKAIQDQIDAIDALTEQENRELEDKQDKDRLAKLSGKDRTDFLAEIERKRLLREREDRKEALRDSIEKVRTDTQNKVDKLNEELEKAQQVERDRLIATENRIKETNVKLDVALEKELGRLATELKEKEKQALEEIGVLNKKLLEEEIANQASYDKRLEQAREYQRKLYEIMGGEMAGVGGVTITPSDLFTTPWGTTVGRGERALGPGEVGNRAEYIGGQGLTGKFFAHGGIVTQPTIGLIGESGPEAIIPLDKEMGGITINFTQPVFFDREDTMNRFVQMIRRGIQRQDRLRFGGAWNGG